MRSKTEQPRGRKAVTVLLFALVFLLTACGGSPSNDTTRDDALALAGVLFAEEMGIAELTSGMKDFIACSFDYQVSQYGLSWTEIEDLLEETGDLDSLDDLNPEAPEEGPEECIGELSVTDFGLMMEASFATAIEDVVGSTSSTYGDDLKLDDLWDACDAGDDDACDELFWSSPVGSAYESFGRDCAGRGCSP